jgi:hypothetical protein
MPSCSPRLFRRSGCHQGTRRARHRLPPREVQAERTVESTSPTTTGHSDSPITEQTAPTERRSLPGGPPRDACVGKRPSGESTRVPPRRTLMRARAVPRRCFSVGTRWQAELSVVGPVAQEVANRCKHPKQKADVPLRWSKLRRELGKSNGCLEQPHFTRSAHQACTCETEVGLRQASRSEGRGARPRPRGRAPGMDSRRCVKFRPGRRCLRLHPDRARPRLRGRECGHRVREIARPGTGVA